MKNQIDQQDLQGMSLEHLPVRAHNPTPEVELTLWLAIVIVTGTILLMTAIRCHAGKQMTAEEQTTEHTENTEGNF